MKLKAFSRLDTDIDGLKKQIDKWRAEIEGIELVGGIIAKSDSACYAHIYYKEPGESEELSVDQILEEIDDSLVVAQFWEIVEEWGEPLDNHKG